MKLKTYTAKIACKGGCGTTLVTATRLSSATNRRNYAGWCSKCMPEDLRKQMEQDSLNFMLGKAA